jgi:predicted RNA polymerase sigma factor
MDFKTLIIRNRFKDERLRSDEDSRIATIVAGVPRHEEASAAFNTAAALTGNQRERELLKRRATLAAAASLSTPFKLQPRVPHGT